MLKQLSVWASSETKKKSSKDQREDDNNLQIRHKFVLRFIYLAPYPL